MHWTNLQGLAPAAATGLGLVVLGLAVARVCSKDSSHTVEKDKHPGSEKWMYCPFCGASLQEERKAGVDLPAR